MAEVILVPRQPCSTVLPGHTPSYSSACFLLEPADHILVELHTSASSQIVMDNSNDT